MNTKKILITGATSGIGRDTVATLAAQGHHLLVHGRSATLVDALVAALVDVAGASPVEGFGVAGKDVGIGSGILVRLALSDDVAGGQGTYYDNDAGRFGPPHRDALDPAKRRAVVAAIDGLISA